MINWQEFGGSHTIEPAMVFISRAFEPKWDPGQILSAPNHQPIERIEAPGKRLFVHTRGCIYYWKGRRHRLRLWRRR